MQLDAMIDSNYIWPRDLPVHMTPKTQERALAIINSTSQAAATRRSSRQRVRHIIPNGITAEEMSSIPHSNKRKGGDRPAKSKKKKHKTKTKLNGQNDKPDPKQVYSILSSVFTCIPIDLLPNIAEFAGLIMATNANMKRCLGCPLFVRPGQEDAHDQCYSDMIPLYCRPNVIPSRQLQKHVHGCMECTTRFHAVEGATVMSTAGLTIEPPSLARSSSDTHHEELWLNKGKKFSCVLSNPTQNKQEELPLNHKKFSSMPSNPSHTGPKTLTIGYAGGKCSSTDMME
jgi:hypothetical protein